MEITTYHINLFSKTKNLNALWYVSIIRENGLVLPLLRQAKYSTSHPPELRR
jgi:hypothetical protein